MFHIVLNETERKVILAGVITLITSSAFFAWAKPDIVVECSPDGHHKVKPLRVLTLSLTLALAVITTLIFTLADIPRKKIILTSVY